MRVLVCGGRDFMDQDWLFRELDALHANRRQDRQLRDIPMPQVW